MKENTEGIVKENKIITNVEINGLADFLDKFRGNRSSLLLSLFWDVSNLDNANQWIINMREDECVTNE